jgi:membrane protease YdiL (CAAX protease family)
MKERFQASDYRFIAICLVLAAAATWYSARNFHRAFPEASIDFRVNRDDGRAIAERFLAARHFRLDGYRDAARFDYDNGAKTFLEREAGLERANRLMSTRVRLWRWSYRWFRPQQKEEFRADVTPAGDVAEFSHEIAEDAARPTLAAPDARALAEAFLRETARRDPAALDFVEVNETVRPHRADRVYVWKERDFNLRDATYRVWVSVLGNEVGGFGEYLKVPEQWQRDYRTLRSKNGMAQNVDQAFMVLLMAGMIVVLVIRTRRYDVRWRRAALIGIAGMALELCASLNGFPLQEFGFPTTDTYGSFLTRELMSAVASALSVGGFLFLIAAGSEPIYREAYGGQVSIGNLFSLRGLRTRRFFKGAILGATLASIFIAYQTVFYLTAYKFGAWSPADVPYSDELNTAFPWLFVLFGGYFPAVFEEFTFRMFAIPFLRKLVRWLPAAVVLAAFLWGFGHSAYPQQPFFIRGVEVGIGGVALGLVMLRWGILPTLVWHYSVDALYSAMLMLRSHSLYFKLSGAASAGIVVLPIVVALFAYWKRGGFDPVEGLLNADEPAPVEPPAAAPVADDAPVYARLGSRTRIAAVAILAAGLATLLIPVERFGQSPKFKLDESQALAYADSFLRAQGMDPSRFRHVVFTQTHWSDRDEFAAKYFLEHGSVSRASQLFERYHAVRYWSVRYFRPLDQEGINVGIHPETGQVIGFSHTLPEERPGADISDDAARQIAMGWAAARGIDVASMDLKESTSDKKKARRDHTLIWEARGGDRRNVGDVRYRTEIDVSGDGVATWRAYWKIPEAFSRARERQNWISISITGVRIAIGLIVVVWGLWLVLRNIRRGLVPWGPVIRVAVFMALLGVVDTLLRLPQIYEGYDTTQPPATFLANVAIGDVISTIGAVLGFGLAAAFLLSFFPGCLSAFRAARRRFTAVDAVAATLAAAGLAVANARLDTWLQARFHAQALMEAGAPGLIESLVPALSGLANAIQGVLPIATAVALVAVLSGRIAKRWWLPLSLVAAIFAVSDAARTPGELALSYAQTLADLAPALIFCAWFARRNYLAYALVIWTAGIRDALGDLLGSPNPVYHLHGWIVLGAAVAACIWLVLPAVRGEVVPRGAAAGA